MAITEMGHQRRSEAIRQVRNSVRLEGVILDDEIEALNQCFIDGEFDKAEHTRLCIEYIRAKHARKVAAAAWACEYTCSGERTQFGSGSLNLTRSPENSMLPTFESFMPISFRTRQSIDRDSTGKDRKSG